MDGTTLYMVTDLKNDCLFQDSAARRSRLVIPSYVVYCTGISIKLFNEENFVRS